MKIEEQNREEGNEMRHCDGLTFIFYKPESVTSFQDLQKPRYENGHKYCTTCQRWLEILQARCPCCKTVLRYKPRHKGKTIIQRTEN